MKHFILSSLLLSLPFAMAQTDSAAGEEAAGEAPAQLRPHQEAFRNLPEERRNEFAKQFLDANRKFQEKRVFEALAALNKAAAIFPDSPEVLNLRGACMVEFRSFEKAMADFNAAAKLAPEDNSIRFNIAEVYFVTHDWKNASEALGGVLEILEKEAADKGAEHQLALRRLIEFKVLLSLIKLDRMDEAEALAGKYDIDDDSPFHCYAQAALAYNRAAQAKAGGDANRNEAQEGTVKAEEWLARATRIFRNPAIISPWQDTLVEFGYIQSFYGADFEEE